MFNFWRKKENKQTIEETTQDIKINREEILSLIDRKKEGLKNSTKDQEIELLNEIAEAYVKISEIDLAIEFYEQSLNKEVKLGKALTELINLYNLKRKEAVMNKDDEKVSKYMIKINELMQLSKDSLRGKI